MLTLNVGEYVNYFMWINDVVWSQTPRQFCFNFKHYTNLYYQQFGVVVIMGSCMNYAMHIQLC